MVTVYRGAEHPLLEALYTALLDAASLNGDGGAPVLAAVRFHNPAEDQAPQREMIVMRHSNIKV